MAKKNTLGSRRRRPKQPDTIDLKANEVAKKDDSKTANSTIAEKTIQAPGKSESKSSSKTVPSSSKQTDDKNKSQEQKPSIDNAKAASNGVAGSGAGAKADAKSGIGTKSETDKRGGMIPLLVSGLIGGGVALGGMSLANLNGVMGEAGEQNSNQEIVALQNQLDALKKQLADQGNQDGKAERALPALLKRVGIIEAKQIETEAGNGGSSNASSEELAKAVKLAEAAKLAADQASSQLAGLKEKIVEGSGAVDTDTLKAALSGDIAALNSRIEKLESAEPAALANQGLEAELKKIETASSENASKISKFDETIGQLKSGNDKLTTEIASLNTKMGALDSVINETVIPNMNDVEKAAGAALEGQKLARSISARALNGVLESGGQFSNELVSAKALLEDNKSVRSLKMYASTGIKSKAKLIEEFSPLATNILSVPGEVDENTGMLGKLFANAKTLVTIRPAGPIAGDSDTAIVSRIDAALKNDDFQLASKEWNGLSEPAKLISKKWALALKDRLKVEELIKDVVDELAKNPTDKG